MTPTELEIHPGETGLRSYLQAMIELHRQIRAGQETLAYSSIEEFVLRAGRFYPWRKRPRKYRKDPSGQCFRNAQILASRRSDLTYCEGFGASVIPLLHAWCIDRKGEVIDSTWNGSGGYWGVTIATKYVMRRMVETQKHISLIDDWSDGWPLLTGLSEDEWRQFP